MLMDAGATSHLSMIPQHSILEQVQHLSTDKDVYVLGSDMVVTLTDPDLNVDASSIETYAHVPT